MKQNKRIRNRKCKNFCCFLFLSFLFISVCIMFTSKHNRFVHVFLQLTCNACIHSTHTYTHRQCKARQGKKMKKEKKFYFSINFSASLSKFIIYLCKNGMWVVYLYIALCCCSWNSLVCVCVWANVDSGSLYVTPSNRNIIQAYTRKKEEEEEENLPISLEYLMEK